MQALKTQKTVPVTSLVVRKGGGRAHNVNGCAFRVLYGSLISPNFLLHVNAIYSEFFSCSNRRDIFNENLLFVIGILTTNLRSGFLYSVVS